MQIFCILLHSMEHNTIITIDESCSQKFFSCDLQRCKGACCTFPGGRGAPLQENELATINELVPVVLEYLSEEHRDYIERYGIIDSDGNTHATQCIDGKACVFVVYESEIAYCAFEKAYREGKSTFPKPISCHLFPLRMDYVDQHLHFEYFHECEPALIKGNNEQMQVIDFLKTPLDRLIQPRGDQHFELRKPNT